MLKQHNSSDWAQTTQQLRLGSNNTTAQTGLLTCMTGPDGDAGKPNVKLSTEYGDDYDADNDG
jgi:hypothetical protein